MPTDTEVFVEQFGFPPPPALLELHKDEAIAPAMPAGFRFSQVTYVLELQYLLSMQDPKNYDVGRKRIAFAVTTDGLELLLDLSSKELEILQKEGDDVDAIGLTMMELRSGEKYSLSPKNVPG